MVISNSYKIKNPWQLVRGLSLTGGCSAVNACPTPNNRTSFSRTAKNKNNMGWQKTAA
jgi:hypothetical protein